MNKIDPNLSITVNILKKEKIFYWIGQGSLLGIIRDNKLIEWDHDIDFCVWHEDNDKDNVIKIMENSNFQYRGDLEIDENRDQLSFDRKGGRRVDINFYQKGKTDNNTQIAFTKWMIPRNFIMKIIDIISYADKYNSKYKFLIKKLSFLKPTGVFLKKKLIEKKLFYTHAGYQQPLELLKDFKLIDFHNLKLTIPLHAVEYLRYLYGENWKIPQKKFSWWKVKNLKKKF